MEYLFLLLAIIYGFIAAIVYRRAIKDSGDGLPGTIILFGVLSFMWPLLGLFVLVMNSCDYIYLKLRGK